MEKTYVTFGQVHVHSVNGQTFDKNCVAVINCANATEGRERAFEYFSNKFCFTYHEEEFTSEKLSYFPRGLIEVNPIIEELR